jgi:short-subunit dehydrogenase
MSLYCSVQKDGVMKQIDKHAYGPWALVTGASSGIGEEFARQALHAELRQAGVNVTVLVPVLVSTPVVARVGLDKLGLPGEPVAPEQAAGEALTALPEGRVSTLDRADMFRAFAGMKGAVVEMITARPAASQPAH